MKPFKKYTPQIVNAVAWEQIEEFYNNLISKEWKLESMLSLVRFIRDNNFDKRLFAYTSLDTLIISIYNPPEWNRESLHIKFDSQSRKWHFKYYSKPYEPSEAERYYPEEEGPNRFCKYLELLKW